jgi:hypothetical protein
VRKLTWAYIALLLVGAVIGVFLLMKKPRYIVTATGGTSLDSIAAYEQRIRELGARLDSMRVVLARRRVLARPAVRLRIAQTEQQLSELKAALRIWRAAHDQYGVGQAYRECVLLYGGVQSACQALSYDTLPPEPDTSRQSRP